MDGDVCEEPKSTDVTLEEWCFLNHEDTVESADDSESVEVLSEGRWSSSSFDDAAEIRSVALNRPDSSLSSKLMARFELEKASKDKNENVVIYVGISLLIFAGIIALKTNEDPGIGASSCSRSHDDSAMDARFESLMREIRILNDGNDEIKAILSTLKDAVAELKDPMHLTKVNTRSNSAHSSITFENDSSSESHEAPAVNSQERLSPHKNTLVWNDALASVKSELHSIRQKLYSIVLSSTVSVKTKIRNSLCYSVFSGNNACSCHYREIFHYSDRLQQSPLASKAASPLLPILSIIDANLKSNLHFLHDFIATTIDGCFLKIGKLLEIGVDDSYKDARDKVLASSSNKTDGLLAKKQKKTLSLEKSSLNAVEDATVPSNPDKLKIKIDSIEPSGKKKASHTTGRAKPVQGNEKKVKSFENSKERVKQQQKKPSFDKKTKKSDREAKRPFQRDKYKRRSDYGSFFHKQFKWLKKGLKYVTYRTKKERDAMVEGMKSLYKKHGSDLFDKINGYFRGFDGLFDPWKFKVFRSGEREKNARTWHSEKNSQEGDEKKDFRRRKFERLKRRDRGRSHKQLSEAELCGRVDSAEKYRKCLSRSDDNNRTETLVDDFTDKEQASWFVRMGKHREDLRLQEGKNTEDWFLRRAKARQGRTR